MVISKHIDLVSKGMDYTIFQAKSRIGIMTGFHGGGDRQGFFDPHSESLEDIPPTIFFC